MKGNAFMKSNKIAYITNLRVFACIGVVLCHVAAKNWYGEIESNRWIVLTIYIAFSRYCVPIFLMISGALFLNVKKEINLKKIYFNNIWKLIVFLFFWGVSYQVYDLIVVQGKLYGETAIIHIIKEAILNVLKGETQAHLWYIYTIIGLYMVVPLLKPWVNNLSKKQIEYFLVLFLVFNVLYNSVCNFNSGVIGTICGFCSKLSINIISGYVGYLVLGYWLGTYDISSKMRKVFYIMGSISCILCVKFTVFYSRYVGQPVEIFWNYLNIFVLFWSICIFVFFKYNMDRVYKRIDFISRYTLGIYACHMFIVFEIWRRGISTFSFCSLVSVPFIVSLVFGSSLCFIYLLSRIPLIKKWII